VDEQQHFKGQVLWQRYPRVMDKPPETTTEGSEPEESCTFRILTVHPVEPGQKDLAVKCNSFPDWDPDDLFEFHGKMVDDSKYGPTFDAEQAVRVIPDTIRGIQKYLENHVKGIGKKTAAAVLMAKFGVSIINVLDNSPERLTECAGIGADKADKIVASWRSQHDPVLRQLELWLARFRHRQAFLGQEVPRRIRQGCYSDPGEESLSLHETEWDRLQEGRRDGCPHGLAGMLPGTDRRRSHAM
jgi:hypothetical protein